MRITGWRALVGDEWLDRPGPERGEIRRVEEADAVVFSASQLEANTDDARYPVVRISAHPEAGERVRCANRNAIRVPSGELVSMPFLEILRRDDSFARLYLHDQLGPVLSTSGLYL